MVKLEGQYESSQSFGSNPQDKEYNALGSPFTKRSVLNVFKFPSVVKTVHGLIRIGQIHRTGHSRLSFQSKLSVRKKKMD